MMKKAFLCIILIVFLLVGCTSSPQKKTEQDLTQVKAKTFDYLICADGFDKQSNLLNTPVLKKLASNANVEPRISFKSDNLQAYLWQLIASDSLPDLITLPAPSNISLQLTNSDYFLTICELSKDLQGYFDEKDAYKTAVFMSDKSSLPTEGVFVNEKYFESKRQPNLSNMKNFTDFINEFKSSVQTTQIPIVFGKSGSDFTTLKHILGIAPPEYTKAIYTEQSQFNKIFEFLSLFKGGLYFNKCNMFEDIEAALNSNSCAYIGSIDTIEQFNLRNPANRYIPIMPFFEKDGFLDSQPLYHTLINRKGKTDISSRFLEYVLSENGKTLIDYGISDEHYYINSEKKQIMQWAIQELQTNREELVLKTGIGLFPFFSDATTPYRQQNIIADKTKVKKIQPFTKINPFPTSYEGNALTYVESTLFDIYSQCLYTGGANAENNSIDSLNKLKSSPEYKIINHYYSK